jgi:hypothetical protein
MGFAISVIYYVTVCMHLTTLQNLQIFLRMSVRGWGVCFESL